MKVVLLALAALAVLWVAALVAIHFVGLGRYKAELGGLLGQLAGRAVRIDGALHLRPGLTLRLEADQVSLANAGWGSRPAMATARRVGAAIRLLPLFRGEIEITGISVEGLDLLLERGPKGAANWDIDWDGPDGATGDAVPSAAVPYRTWRTRIERLEVRDAYFAYRSSATAPPLVGNVARLELRSQAENAPLEISGEADLAGVRGVFDGRSLLPWRWNLDGFGVTGALDLQAADPEQAAVALDLDASLLTNGTLRARIDADGSRLTLHDIAAQFGANDLAGELSLSWAEDRPRLSGSLQSRRLALADFVAQPVQRAPAGSSDASPRPLPWWLLTSLDADLSVSAATVHMPSGGVAAGVVAKMTLENGDLRAELSGGSTARGYAEVKAEARAAAQRLHVDVRAEGLPLESLVSSAYVRGAALSADVHLGGRGTTSRAVTRTLAGEGIVEITGGTLNGRTLDRWAGDVLLQIVDLINPKARTSGPKRLQCGVAKARVRNGVVEFDKGLALETEDLRVLGAGTLDLASGDIDLALRTDPKGGAGVSVATVVDSLIRIRGPYTDPKMAIDPTAAVRAPLRVGGALLSGGLSLVDDLLRLEMSADVSPCLVARGSVPAPKSKAQEVEASAGKIGKTVGKGVDAAGRRLEKLFGR